MPDQMRFMQGTTGAFVKYSMICPSHPNTGSLRMGSTALCSSKARERAALHYIALQYKGHTYSHCFEGNPAFEHRGFCDNTSWDERFLSFQPVKRDPQGVEHQQMCRMSSAVFMCEIRGACVGMQ